MSRRIVQLVDSSDGLVALDNNGVAWRLVAVQTANAYPPSSTWYRLPALPSLENLTPRPPAFTEPSSTAGE